MDGFGIAPQGKGNAVTQANLETFNQLWNSFPHTTLAASGEAVGLPRGEAGNTETGHLNLGAGRIVYQDLPRINMAIADGSFYQNKAFLQAIEHCQKHNGKLHILGLIGSGTVHSSMDHLFALLHFCREQQFDRVYLHLITDGRDSPPKSALTFVQRVKKEIQDVGIGKIATVAGRYWAMDRDMRWDRTEKAYLAMTQGKGHQAKSVEEAINKSYYKGITDEFIEPTVITDENDEPTAMVSSGDSVIFYNFRIDRARQITKAFVLEDFAREALKAPGFDPYAIEFYKKHVAYHLAISEPFERGPKLRNLFFVSMTEYERGLPVDAIAFPPEKVIFPLGEVLSAHECFQLRTTETEKERFVTFYFNGQREEPFPNEDRIIIPSPKVPTYDLKPEMSSEELTNSIIEQLKRNRYHSIVVNFPNPDMVGHTGVLHAAILACQAVDQCLKRIIDQVLTQEGYCIITADHGNAEEMIDPETGEVDTEHSSNPVPFIAVGKEFSGQGREIKSGILADVAPTILYLHGIDKPEEMTGRNLLEGFKLER